MIMRGQKQIAAPEFPNVLSNPRGLGLVEDHPALAAPEQEAPTKVKARLSKNCSPSRIDSVVGRRTAAEEVGRRGPHGFMHAHSQTGQLLHTMVVSGAASMAARLLHAIKHYGLARTPASMHLHLLLAHSASYPLPREALIHREISKSTGGTIDTVDHGLQ
jgi:hypothetical protein